ncbi:MAG: phosphoribosyltransferase family protein [Bacteroidales bacterium]|jgi:hypothetical protein|nr:phosphoribosyltransferase family protein [Bacteroidales bacterium]
MTSKQNYNGQIIHYSLHAIHSQEDVGFIPEEYSKFKHGAENIARKYGYELAEKFITNCLKGNYNGKQIIILPSAYSHIPTASFYMKKYFVNKLNSYLFDAGYPVTEETKIYRSVSYRDDYGEMSAEQRYNLIKGDAFYIDKKIIGDKIILHLDDIKITGTHEQIIINMLNSNKLENMCYMLYFAELASEKLPPNIENYLNHKYVKSLDEIDFIIKNEQFCINTRVVKYILNSTAIDFDNFIEKQQDNFINDLYYNAIGNEYFKFPAYLRNLNHLKQIINT